MYVCKKNLKMKAQDKPIESVQRIKELIQKRIEPSAAVLTVGGLLAWIGHIPMADMLLSVGLISLIISSFILTYIPRPMPTGGTVNRLLDITLPKLEGVSIAVVLTGILFKLNFWEGSRSMLEVAAAPCFWLCCSKSIGNVFEMIIRIVKY
jgi:hypothetical protein